MDWGRGAARRVENSSIRLSCEEQDRCLQFCEQIPGNEEKVVEINFILTIPTNALNHLNTTRELKIEEVISAFDNTGKKVELLTNGLLGRIKIDFKQMVKIQATKTQPTKIHPQ